MCEAYPQRRHELDTYERHIVEIAHKFGGSSFYEYHKAFSARAAAMLLNYNIKINWAHKDTNLFCMTFAGQSAIACNMCKSKAHTTLFCPQSSDKPKHNTSYRGYGSNVGGNNMDVKGRPKLLHLGKEICNNLNEREGCPRSSDCYFSHVCSKCRKPRHGAFQCALVLNTVHQPPSTVETLNVTTPKEKNIPRQK
jgi:hypothetical protein